LQKHRQQQQQQQQQLQQQQQQQSRPESVKKRRKSTKKLKTPLAKSISSPLEAASASTSASASGVPRRIKPPQLQIAATELSGSSEKQKPRRQVGRRVSAGSAPSSPDRLVAPHLHPSWMQPSASASAAAGADGPLEGGDGGGATSKRFMEDLAFSFKTGSGHAWSKKRASVDHPPQLQQLQRGLSKGRRCSNVLTDMMRAFTTGTRGKL